MATQIKRNEIFESKGEMKRFTVKINGSDRKARKYLSLMHKRVLDRVIAATQED